MFDLERFHGKYGVLYEEGEVKRQCQVHYEVSPGFFLVRWFSFLTGAPTSYSVIPLEELTGVMANGDGWEFYHTANDMIEAIQKVGA